MSKVKRQQVAGAFCSAMEQRPFQKRVSPKNQRSRGNHFITDKIKFLLLLLFAFITATTNAQYLPNLEKLISKLVIAGRPTQPKMPDIGIVLEKSTDPTYGKGYFIVKNIYNYCSAKDKIKINDIVTHINDISTLNMDNWVSAYKEGKNVKLTIQRLGVMHECWINVTPLIINCNKWYCSEEYASGWPYDNSAVSFKDIVFYRDPEADFFKYKTFDFERALTIDRNIFCIFAKKIYAKNYL